MLIDILFIKAVFTGKTPKHTNIGSQTLKLFLSTAVMSSKYPSKFPKFFGKVQVWIWPHLCWKQNYYFWLKHIIALAAWNKEWQSDDNSFILPYSFLGWKPSLIKKGSRDTQIPIANSVDVSNGCDPRIKQCTQNCDAHLCCCSCEKQTKKKTSK